MVYIGSDHGGFRLKESLKKYLVKKNIKFEDLGAPALNAKDDYPDYAEKVARAVAKNPDSHMGILMCRSGQGMCIAANKVSGVRAASAWNLKLAYSTRNDDGANILCLATDYMSEKIALNIATVFINTPFSKAARHGRRVLKIKKMEK